MAHKKNELDTFEKLLNQFEEFKENYITQNMLTNPGEENIWQHFFENNKWIFGYGLNYIFLDKVNKKLETPTTGQTFEHSGKRVDAFMRTKAEVSQTVFIELKKPSDPLVNQKEYRSGCWTVSQPIYEAIGQVQKTVFDFLKDRSSSRFELKDDAGVRTGDEVYIVTPKSYVIIGRLKSLKGQDDKVECFELFRRSIGSPEIITYDELFERAKCIVETLSQI